VILVVFLFLRDPRTTFIPSVAVPVSLIGTFGAMYLLGYSLDNLSLMALTISTGFVVDDAIVVIENIMRYLEQGMHPYAAALKGAQEIGFTVLTMSISLVAVFIPLLLMGGIVGRLFREFAVTLSVAIAISMVVSLTATPMMCAHLLREQGSHGWLYRVSERGFNAVVNAYGRALTVVLRHSFITLMVLLATIALNVVLVERVPKGFFPQQDVGRMNGSIVADQDTSFTAMDKILQRYVNIIDSDQACGYGERLHRRRTRRRHQFGPHVHFAETSSGTERRHGRRVINRLRPKLARVAGATCYLQTSQDLRVGGRQSNAQYQFTMRGDNVDELNSYGPKMLDELRAIPLIVDTNTDQQDRGLMAWVQYDRKTASRFGISSQLVDSTLYDAFGQSPVSTMYTMLNQYHVIMEAAPQYWQNPDTLKKIYVMAPGERGAAQRFAHFEPRNTALSVNHQGLFPSVTISFNLRPGVALGDAEDAINAAASKVGLPPTIQTIYAGTAAAYKDFPGQRAMVDRSRAGRGLPGAGHSV
jgi:multidrug efflux pump